MYVNLEQKYRYKIRSNVLAKVYVSDKKGKIE